MSDTTTAEIALETEAPIVWPNREGENVVATFSSYDYDANMIVYLCEGAEIRLAHTDIVELAR